MFEQVKIQSPEDFFLGLKDRKSYGTYFYRIAGYNEYIGSFIRKYYEAARRTGVIIEGKISNPDEKNLAYYEEILGTDFRLSTDFFISNLAKWLPRMDEKQKNNVAAAFYDTLETLRKKGKNENMLKNAYVKFMCWLYYKFERIMNQLGTQNIPKILYEGEVSYYELLMFRILARSGCDILLLQYRGDGAYQGLTLDFEVSELLSLPEMTGFPPDFSLKSVREEIQKEVNRERLYGKRPELLACTNAWISGKGLEDVETSPQDRGNDKGLFYNCLIRINGAEDKVTYLNRLYQFQLELKNQGRRLVIVDGEIPQPTTEEVKAVNRGNYLHPQGLIMGLMANLTASDAGLRQIMVKGFVDLMLEEADIPGISLNRLTTKAVILLCLVKRYQNELLANWRPGQIGCFIHLGGCRNANEAFFLRFLSRLPVDVLILRPDLNQKCCLEDRWLYEINYTDSLAVEHFPTENSQLHIATAAYHAERELDTIMYGESGLYRNQQYKKATSVTLRTMYEEIAILWKQELKYRPSFSIMNDVVNIPVILAKVSGVKDGNVSAYWSSIRALLTEETCLISKVPFVDTQEANPVKYHVTEFFKDQKLQRERIKSHQVYQYGMLREEIQEHILDKLQLLIDQKTIKGTLENGMEYTIIATIMNMPREIVRMIQRFDFTRTNPKIIYINATESMISLEDSILMAFLNLVGFDIVFFVPTGYQTIEKYFNRPFVEVYQEGEYVYDLRIPEFNSSRQRWREKIFRRGV